MFAKPYKQKSNNTLKNTEKKQLVQRIHDAFPGVSEDKLKDLVPVKSNSSCMKLILHSGDIVGVYVVDGYPMVIETNDGLIPTVCALWKVPELLPTLIIHSPVVAKVVNGAPLYVPGVIRSSLPRFSRGSVLGAATADNRAAAIVGRATLSTHDMQYIAGGICMETLHVYGDLLCKDPKFSKIVRPSLGPATGASDVADSLAADINQLSIQPPLKEEWPSLGRTAPAPVPAPVPALIPDQPVPDIDHEDDEELDNTAVTDSSQLEEDNIPEDLDGLLRWCLLSFIKLEGKRIELPLKTNLLYKNHLMPYCPPNRTLDVKKSSYKKMSKFLEAMQQEGLLEVREIEKGVDAVVGVCTSHPSVRVHAPPTISAPPTDQDLEYVPPVIREVYCITANVAPIFPELKKGSPVSTSEVRSAVMQYANSRGLRAGAGVTLDAVLAKVVGKPEQEVVPWDATMSAVLSRCTAATDTQFPDGTRRLARSRLPPITMAVATRSGNKKVTLVSNLEAYGFRLSALSRECQRGVAAACGVTRAPAAGADQLMLQGDQTHYVAKLLIEKYGLPKKFVDGADKALKKKK